LNCVPIASAEGLRAEKLGQANLVEEIETSEGKIVKVTGVPQPCKTVSILCRGSNKLVRTPSRLGALRSRPSPFSALTSRLWQVLEENERSIHDALCVVRSLFKKR
jgi:T-complex protein 1 subunit delta